MQCFKCREEIRKGTSVKCSKCRRKFHTHCVVCVKKKLFKRVWKCYDCLKEKSEVKKPACNSSRCSSSKHDQHSTQPRGNVNSRLDEISKQIKKLSLQVNDLQNDNNKLKHENIKIRAEIDRLCIRPCQPQCTGLCSSKKLRRTSEPNCVRGYREQSSQTHEDEYMSSRGVHGVCKNDVCPYIRHGSPITTKLIPMVAKLEVTAVNLHIEENGQYHFTNRYSIMRKANPQLVVRRGQVFKLLLTLNRPYLDQDDEIAFIFTHKVARHPSIGSKTKVVTRLEKHLKEANTSLWSSLLIKNQGEYLTVFITPAASAIIGEWIMEIDCIASRKVLNTYRHHGSIIVIFNAWCKDDAVYLEKDAEREEYVLNDSGFYWSGNFTNSTKRPWKFGQYEEDILLCSLMILEQVSEVPLIHCNDTVTVSRAISAVMKLQDENGVLMSNWTGNYEGGKEPSKWISSSAILKKYYDTGEPVKYGQCWVFSAVVVTMCRAVGIPVRLVTCFDAAQEYELSFTIDTYLNDHGERINELSEDTVWNFHTWNEVWTKRPDLDSKYDGWQVLDATPQERNEMLFRTGPSPVKAIKNGDLYIPYDTAFICAEVNCDFAIWKYQGSTVPLKLIQSNTDRVGRLICTKAVGQDTMEDLTESYKYREGIAKEREIFQKMVKASGSVSSRYYLNETLNDVKFEFEFMSNSIIGKPFSINLVAKNVNASHEHKVTAQLVTCCRDYTGQDIKLISSKKKIFTVPAVSRQTVQIEVQYADYAIVYKTDASIYVSALCSFEDNGFEYYAEDYFRVKLPSINITV
ncbi:hypothetical protein O3M35_005727 [Rhynocoris fuscipes]|uniref:PHD-type domain-containing protein n=1 Tax=Rhynocoris fuscipes TaxID=488301 RepID=A0AAW1DLA2_9HEMI